MRAVVVPSYGEPDVLTVADLPVPPVGPGQVRVRVQAAPVHPVDLFVRGGGFAAALPKRDVYVLGWDFAGAVDAVGSGVTGFAAGDAVVGLSDWFDTQIGAQAEYVVLGADALAAVPAGLTPVEASTLPLNALTAAQALDQLGLAEGRTLGVTGAAGAVGAFAVELAVRRGLRVFGIAGPQDEEFVRGLGATFVPRTDDPAGALRAAVPGGVDGLLDAAVVGVPAIGAVRDGGAFAAVVEPAAPPTERGIRVHPIHVHSDGAQLAELLGGGLVARVAATYPFEEAARAHERLAKGGVRGRLVLVP
jgi:NADPH:quinone reductase-like Zn-dependent oxidoreductase